MNGPQLILLVEDSDDDVFFFERALLKTGIRLQTRRVHNGQEAIDYLQGIGPFADRVRYPWPQVIMLDLKMPICDGFDFLQWKRKQPSLVYLRTIVMTSSDMPRDVRRSYELGAHSFTTKLRTPDCLSSRIEALSEWWFQNCVIVPVPQEKNSRLRPDSSPGNSE